MKLASRFGAVNLVRRDRPLTRDELAYYVPSVFSEEKHASRSERYTCIPTITLLDNLQREGFQPFFACQTRVRDQSKREHTKHMLRLRREGQIAGKQVPEIILLNSHDGSSSYQMLPGLFRAVCQNGLICGESFGEVRVPHKGDVVGKVIEGAYEVLGCLTGWRRSGMRCSHCCCRRPRSRCWRKPPSPTGSARNTSR
jgi:hypothetical protein